MADDVNDTGVSSYLKEETRSMDLARRELEKQGLRALLGKKVHDKDHSEKIDHRSLSDADYEQSREAHPLLEDSQLLDGVEIDAINDPEILRKIENKKRDQAREKQLRLEQRLELQLANQPKFNPTPRGP